MGTLVVVLSTSTLQVFVKLLWCNTVSYVITLLFVLHLGVYREVHVRHIFFWTVSIKSIKTGKFIGWVYAEHIYYWHGFPGFQNYNSYFLLGPGFSIWSNSLAKIHRGSPEMAVTPVYSGRGPTVVGPQHRWQSTHRNPPLVSHYCVNILH